MRSLKKCSIVKLHFKRVCHTPAAEFEHNSRAFVQSNSILHLYIQNRISTQS
jgi:hypothetical protein